MGMWSTTFVFGDFRVSFKIFEFGPVKQLYTKLKTRPTLWSALPHRAVHQAPAPTFVPWPSHPVGPVVTPSAPLCHLGSRTTGPPPAFPSSLLFPPRLASTRAGHRCRGRPELCTPGVEAKRRRWPSCHYHGRRLTSRHLSH
jgi:hypothetical protein